MPTYHKTANQACVHSSHTSTKRRVRRAMKRAAKMQAAKELPDMAGAYVAAIPITNDHPSVYHDADYGDSYLSDDWHPDHDYGDPDSPENDDDLDLILADMAHHSRL